ncbi:MAG: arsenite methyltransferase [Planctomycetota bacterium]|nr:arsenite methyltransferase [Planctomycetota bacterium]
MSDATRPMNDLSHEEIRDQVAKSYAKALTDSQGCCTPACCEPPAATAAKVAGYGDELAQHTEAGQSSFGCGNPLAFAEVQEGETVLDLGSGAGLDLLIAADKVGETGRVIGVDMTDEMIEAARANAAKAGHGQVEVRKGVIEALPVDDASVDWVISNCVVNLSPEKERVFAEIFRVLKPGGRFSVSDIVAEQLPESVRDFAAAYHACIAGAISETDYVEGLRAAGLEEVSSSERFEYEIEHLRGLVGADLDRAGASKEELDAVVAELEKVAGTVASVRLSGRKPA